MIARPPTTRRSGISLIEVLLALAIFLLSLVAIGRLVDLGTDQAMDANVQATGVRLAQSKLAEAEAGAISLTGGTSGTFEEDPEWEFDVDPVQTDVPNVYDVTVRVTHTRGGRQQTVTLGQMILDPTQMGTAAEAQKPQTTTTSGGTTTGGTGP